MSYEISKRLETKAWLKAASHHSGQGLGEGLPYLQPAMDAKRQLERTGNRSLVRALERVIIGASWTGSRLKAEHDRLLEAYGKGSVETTKAATSREALGDTIHSTQ